MGAKWCGRMRKRGWRRRMREQELCGRRWRKRIGRVGGGARLLVAKVGEDEEWEK